MNNYRYLHVNTRCLLQCMPMWITYYKVSAAKNARSEICKVMNDYKCTLNGLYLFPVMRSSFRLQRHSYIPVLVPEICFINSIVAHRTLCLLSTLTNSFNSVFHVWNPVFKLLKQYSRECHGLQTPHVTTLHKKLPGLFWMLYEW